MLALQPNVLSGGSTYKFTLHVTLKSGDSQDSAGGYGTVEGHASLWVTTLGTPALGTVSVEPPSGDEMATVFELKSTGKEHYIF